MKQWLPVVLRLLERSLDMDHKHQHFVTESSLKAWRDPQTRDGAFVWVVSKEDRAIWSKAPKSLFSEVDFYTVYDSDGNRILELEHKLKEVEDKFISLRDRTLFNRKPLSEGDRLVIALFVSTMYARTKFQRDMQKELWQELIDAVNKLPQEISEEIKETKEYKGIQILHAQPMPFHIFNFVNIATPILFKMNTAIFETNVKPGFITCDNPCFWADPAKFHPNEPITWFGLGSPKLNIILPISPTQVISLQRGGPDGYALIHPDPEKQEEMVDYINSFMVANSERLIIVNQNTYKEK